MLYPQCWQGFELWSDQTVPECCDIWCCTKRRRVQTPKMDDSQCLVEVNEQLPVASASSGPVLDDTQQLSVANEQLPESDSGPSSDPQVHQVLGLYLPGQQQLSQDLQQEPLVNLIPIIEANDPRLESHVVNLSQTLLTNDQLTVLSLGLKFRWTPATVPYLHYYTIRPLLYCQLTKGERLSFWIVWRTGRYAQCIFRTVLTSLSVNLAREEERSHCMAQREIRFRNSVEQTSNIWIHLINC